jgi:hypothetical protein
MERKGKTSMKRRQAPWILLLLSFALSAHCRGPADKGVFFQNVVSGMPDYRDFLTVDELHASLRDLKERYPDVVSLDTVVLVAEHASSKDHFEK